MKCNNPEGCMHANSTVHCAFQCPFRQLVAPEPNALANALGLGNASPYMQAAPALTKPVQVKRVFEPEPHLIEQLEKLLVEAKTGKLRSLAYAMVHHDDLIQSGELNSGWYIASGTSFALGEAIARLRHKWDIDRDKDSA